MSEDRSLRQSLKRLPGASAISGGTERLVAAQQQRLDEMQAMLESHEQSLRSLTAAVHALEQHLPNVLNTIASGHGSQRQLRSDLDTVQQDLQRQLDAVWQNFASGVDPQLAQLWERVETVRKEILFELRYGGGERPSTDQDGPVTATRVLDEEKVAAAIERGLRLNLGCGHVPLDDYVNVDMRELPGVDVVAPVDELPFEAATVREIFSSHVLEHFPLEQLRRRLLPYWVSMLAPGGTFRAVVPDAEAMVRRHHDGEIPFEQFREVFFGGQEYEGDFHFNMFTTESLSELLRGAGLVEVRIEDDDRVNGNCREFQIAATRPG